VAPRNEASAPAGVSKCYGDVLYVAILHIHFKIQHGT